VSALVQVALAESVAEAEEIEAILREAGIEVQLESAVDHHPREVDDAPLKVFVPEEHLEAAREAIESMTDPEEDPIADA
jgi:alkylation response protein AidB-like acyl-CoA dehydrogenase